MTISLADLRDALRLAPVMGQFHPLVSLCLSAEVETISELEAFIEELDALEPHTERPVLIPALDSKLVHRFLVMSYPACPPVEEINAYLPRRIDEARRRLLTGRNIADQIVTDVRVKRYQTVALLLVDGLGYADVIDWPEQPSPCFIDGPSITFSRTPDGQIDPQVGFPAIVGTPPLSRRLIDVGLSQSRGFSYWERTQNDVSEKLFQGMPLQKVSGLAESLAQLEAINLKGVYIQLVREGLDGLAHSRREVSQQEIKATIEAIHQDLRELVELLAKKDLDGAVYLVADHGVLWKNQHQWQPVESGHKNRPRYTTVRPDLSEFVTRFPTEEQEFYLWHYPYLGKQIKANDSGVHGGLSYWESIVPFVRMEIGR